MSLFIALPFKEETREYFFFFGVGSLSVFGKSRFPGTNLLYNASESVAGNVKLLANVLDNYFAGLCRWLEIVR